MGANELWYGLKGVTEMVVVNRGDSFDCNAMLPNDRAYVRAIVIKKSKKMALLSFASISYADLHPYSEKDIKELLNPDVTLGKEARLTDTAGIDSRAFDIVKAKGLIPW